MREFSGLQYCCSITAFSARQNSNQKGISLRNSCLEFPSSFQVLHLKQILDAMFPDHCSICFYQERYLKISHRGRYSTAVLGAKPPQPWGGKWSRVFSWPCPENVREKAPNQWWRSTVILALKCSTTVNKQKFCIFPYQRKSFFEYFMKTLDVIGNQWQSGYQMPAGTGQICKRCNYPRVARLVQDSPGILQYAWSAPLQSLFLQKRAH